MLFLRYLNIFARLLVLAIFIGVPIYVIKAVPKPNMNGHNGAVEYLYDVRLLVTSVSGVSSNVSQLTLTYLTNNEMMTGTAGTTVNNTKTWSFSIPIQSDGYFASKNELTMIGFNLTDNTGAVIATGNASSIAMMNFPTAAWSVKNAVDTSGTLALTNGMIASYRLLIIPSLGLSGNSLLVVAMALLVVQTVFCMLIASLDMCFCQGPAFGSKSEAWSVWTGNAVWLLLGGLIISKFYLLFGLLMMLTIIGIPFGIKLIKLGGLAMSPFGRQVSNDNDESDLEECCGCALNLLWGILAGWILALLHFVFGIVQCLLILTIPLGLQNFKLGKMVMRPFGLESDYLREDEAENSKQAMLLNKGQGMTYAYGV